MELGELEPEPVNKIIKMAPRSLETGARPFLEGAWAKRWEPVKTGNGLPNTAECFSLAVSNLQLLLRHERFGIPDL